MVSDERMVLIDKLISYYREQKLDDAQAFACELTDKYPDQPIGWKVLGALLLKKGEVKNAVYAMLRNVDLTPNDPEANNNLSAALRDSGNLTDAELYANKALEINPNFAEAYCNLGSIKHEFGMLNDAITHYRMAIILKKDYYQAYYNLSIALKEQENLDEAEKTAEHAIKLEPHSSESYHMLALIYSEKRAFYRSLKALDAAVSLDPKKPKYLAERVRIKSILGLLDGSIRDSQKYLKLTGGKDDTTYNVITSLRHCLAMKLISQFEISKAIKKVYIGKASNKKTKKIDIVSFFIPPNEASKEFKQSHKASWEFFLQAFYTRARLLLPESRIILLTSENAKLSSNLPNYEVIRAEVESNTLMYSRLICQLNYMELREENTASFVLDMDVLINKIPLHLVDSDYDVGLTVRDYMPPINAGVMFLNSGCGALTYLRSTLSVYDKLVELTKEVPIFKTQDLKRWWGDQIAMCGAAGILHPQMLFPSEYEFGNVTFSLLDCDRYNYTPEAINEKFLKKDISNKYFLHIKGTVNAQELNYLKRLGEIMGHDC